MKEISKEDIALEQLRDAIELFEKECHISSITLAGVAEEILGQFLRMKGKKEDVLLLSFRDVEVFLFSQTPGLMEGSDYVAQRTKIRNELKHHGESHNKDSLTEDFQYCALTHIAGAITNYKLIFGNIPVNQTIAAFSVKYGIN